MSSEGELPTILTVNLAPGIERFLRERWGHRCEIVSVANAFEAGLQFARSRPDLVVTDSRLPALTGADLVAAARGVDDTDRPEVVVFARSEGSEGVAAGAAFLVTPATSKSHVTSWFENFVDELDAAASPPALDADMSTSINSATRDVLASVLGIEIEFGQLSVDKAGPRIADVIGTISIAGHVSGGVTIFSSLPLARLLTQQMLCSEGEDVSDEELVDAIGELTNMIAGNIKTQLCQGKELFSMSSPSVVLGREVRRIPSDELLAFALPCDVRGAEFLVEFNLAPSSVPSAAGR